MFWKFDMKVVNFILLRKMYVITTLRRVIRITYFVNVHCTMCTALYVFVGGCFWSANTMLAMFVYDALGHIILQKSAMNLIERKVSKRSMYRFFALSEKLISTGYLISNCIN